MILVDTNVLVALADERDRLHAKAKRDLDALSGPFLTTSVVLSEACFLLTDAYFRERLRFLIDRLPLRVIELEERSWPSVFEWLSRYGEHAPDLCDAQLVVLAEATTSSIWSYDGEFKRTWRSPTGAVLRVVPAGTAVRRRRGSRKH